MSGARAFAIWKLLVSTGLAPGASAACSSLASSFSWIGLLIGTTINRLAASKAITWTRIKADQASAMARPQDVRRIRPIPEISRNRWRISPENIPA